MERSVGGRQKIPKVMPHEWGGALADNRKTSHKSGVERLAGLLLPFNSLILVVNTMKIIEQGKKIDLSIRFICDMCGCVFEADRNEYEYNQREDEFFSTCPNCHCGTSHTSGNLDNALTRLKLEDIHKF